MKKLITIIMSALLAFGFFTLTACKEEGGSTAQVGWIVNTGVPTAEVGDEGAMYLDSETYDIYWKSNGAWQKIGNIKGETGAQGATGAQGPQGEQGVQGVPGIQGVPGSNGQNGKDGVTPTVSINEDGYLVINGEVTDHYVGDEKITKEEFEAQVAHYGSPSQYSKKTRLRVTFSVKMKAGTKFTFLGDTAKYKWSINEAENNGYMFSPYKSYDPGWNITTPQKTGWVSSTEYKTTLDYYPIIVMAKQDGTEFTNDELTSIHSWFAVDGVKLTPVSLNNAGKLTEKEFKSQVPHVGSVPMPVSEAHARISFSVKMQKGTKIKYIGDDTYQFAVVETSFTAREGSILDSGWITGDTYETKIDGTYPVITLKRKDGANIASAQLPSIMELFTVDGYKYTQEKQVERENYALKSVNHRGFCYLAPENTLEAYRLSAKRGFKYVECDVQFTSDSVPVLLHDGTIDRTSNGTGNISSITLQTAQTYDFGSWFAPEYKGTEIPTFDAFIKLCAELNLHPYIELKSTITEQQAQALVKIVTDNNMKGKVTWISFGLDALSKIVAVDNTARLGYVVNSDVLQSTVNDIYALKNANNEVFIDAYFSKATSSAALLCKTKGVGLEVWTVDKVADAKALDAYISGVTTNWMIVGEQLEA